MTEQRNKRKVRTGMVTSDAGDKTIAVTIERRVRHPLYGRVILRKSKLIAHDEKNEAHVGDLVEVMEARPVSKTKRWRLVSIIERAK
ncbi:30S ribosomal protein S17 [Candidatus Latescibacterota bacterium]